MPSAKLPEVKPTSLPVTHDLALEDTGIALSSASALDTTANALVYNPDRWEFTPLKSGQFFTQNPNLYVDSSVAHDAFLIFFVITVLFSFLEGVWNFIRNRKAETLEEKLEKIGKKAGTRAITEIHMNEAKGADDTAPKASDSEGAPLVGAKESELQSTYWLCAQAYISDAVSDDVVAVGDEAKASKIKKIKYVPTYSVLIRENYTKNGKPAKRYALAKLALPDDIDTFNRGAKLKELVGQWKESRTSFLQKLNTFWKSLNYKELSKFVLGFFYNMALWYWVIWFISAGFVGFAGSLTIAFGSPVIAFVIPVAVTIAWYIIKAYIVYKRGNIAITAEKAFEMDNLVENLLKLKAENLDKDLPAETPISGVNDLGTLTAMENALKENTSDEVKKALKFKSRLDLEDLAVKETSQRRQYLAGARNFVAYFIVFAFTAWVTTDVLSVLGVLSALSVPSAAILIIVPIVIALVAGAFFAADAYKKAGERETDLETKLAGELKTKFENLVKEVRLRYAYLLSLEGITPEEKGNIEKVIKPIAFNQPVQTVKGKLSYYYELLKVWVGSAGGGSLIARLFIGVFGALAQIGLMTTFSFSSAPVISAVVLFAIVWSGVVIVAHLQNKKMEKAEKMMADLPTELKIYESANEQLKQLEVAHVRLPSVGGLHAGTAAATAAPVPVLTQTSTASKGPVELDVSDDEPLLGHRVVKSEK